MDYIALRMDYTSELPEALDTRTFDDTLRCSFSLTESRVTGAIQADRIKYRFQTAHLCLVKTDVANPSW